MKPEFEKIQNQPNHSFLAKVVKRPKRPTLKEAWHFHPEVEICLTVKSEGKRFVGNNISDYQKGDLVMFGSNLPHGFITEVPSEQIVIQMQESFLGSEFLDKPETKSIKKLFDRSGRGILFVGKTQKQAKKVVKQLLNAEGLDKIILLLKLLKILESSGEFQYIINEHFHADTKVAELERIQQVYDYILKNYKDNVSLAEAASILNMTKSSFCKFLKKHAKKTFSEIVNGIRIDHACRLMIQTDKKIATIAYESGFNDVSYFSRTFKRIMETNPKDFMKRY